MHISTIYKITNTINGKVYIGFDTKWPNRKYSHKSNIKHHRQPKKLLYKAMHKYGWDNFTWDIIYQSLDEKHCRTQMEPYFIKEYNGYFTTNLGYNMTYGGEGERGNSSRTNMPHSEKTKRKISKNRKGLGVGFNNAMANPEYRQKAKDGFKYFILNHPEYCESIRQRRLGTKRVYRSNGSFYYQKVS